MASGAQTARESRNASRQDQSIEALEAALEPKPTKRPNMTIASGEPRSIARVLQEENQLMVQEKLNRKLLEDKKSKELEQSFIQKSQLKDKEEQAKGVGQRQAQRELSDQYRARISEKEEAKANRYQMKVKNGPGINFFPFVDGERVKKDREAKEAAMHLEMQGFLQKQREERPQREDAGNPQLFRGHMVDYPPFPPLNAGRADPVSARGRPCTPRAAGEGPLGAAGSSTLGNARQPGTESQSASAKLQATGQVATIPRFLQRPPNDHVSRRVDDSHVRKALEDKVLETKKELATLAKKKQMDAQQWQEGLAVSEAIGADSSEQKAIKVRKHAEDLKLQIEEGRQRAAREKEERRTPANNYWGPEERKGRNNNVDREVCQHLIAQMKVDQERKIMEKELRHQQERRIVDNCLAEMTQDRLREAEKIQQHREVLVTTWNSQKRIKEVFKEVEAAL